MTWLRSIIFLPKLGISRLYQKKDESFAKTDKITTEELNNLIPEKKSHKSNITCVHQKIKPIKSFTTFRKIHKNSLILITRIISTLFPNLRQIENDLECLDSLNPPEIKYYKNNNSRNVLIEET